jgi:hypothetical protein
LKGEKQTFVSTDAFLPLSPQGATTPRAFTPYNIFLIPIYVPAKRQVVIVFLSATLVLSPYLSSKSQHLRHTQELITQDSNSLRRITFLCSSIPLVKNKKRRDE